MKILRRQPLPRNYVAIDFEADGLNPHKALIFEVGMVLVLNGVLTGPPVELHVDWTKHGVDGAEWSVRLDAVRPHLQRPDGFPTLAYLQQHGLAPAEALQHIHGVLASCDDLADGNASLVGHNIDTYDRRLLLAWYHRLGWTPPAVLVDDRRIVDTLKLEPRGNGSRKLSHLCQHYGLIKEGEEQNWHTAGFDALMACRLLEHQRRCQEGVPHGP